MTLKQLKSRVKVTETKNNGQYDVEITYYGKTYHCQSNDSWAYDRAICPEKSDGYYTQKQAYQAFYDECKRKNHLGEKS